jgi:hypothetical protein
MCEVAVTWGVTWGAETWAMWATWATQLTWTSHPFHSASE